VLGIVICHRRFLRHFFHDQSLSRRSLSSVFNQFIKQVGNELQMVDTKFNALAFRALCAACEGNFRCAAQAQCGGLSPGFHENQVS
jgi:hypothetical protein